MFQYLEEEKNGSDLLKVAFRGLSQKVDGANVDDKHLSIVA
jgi:hypothetical protein